MNTYRKPFLLLLLLWAGSLLPALAEDFTKYLFVYFPSNSNENVYYALSDNGYDYTPMNDGQMIVSADTISLKKGVRDPHILRGNDGWFYMVLTDMRCAEGWDSNRGLVMMKSRDLVNWTHSTVHFPDKYKGTMYAKVNRVWAPETIWDPQAGKYMVYFSLLTSDRSIPYDKVFYCYANEDFTDLEGEPVYLYDRGSATIDMDIVFNEQDGLYHAFYKNEGEGGICKVTAQTLTAADGEPLGSQWSSPSGTLQQTNVAVEGAGVFKLINEDKWILMYDCYTSGYYQFCESTDLTQFTFVRNTYTSGAFTPRHGTVIPVTDAEVAAINDYFAEKQEEARRRELQQLKEQLTGEVERAQLMGVDVSSAQEFLQQESFTKDEIQSVAAALNVDEFSTVAANYPDDKTSLLKTSWTKVNQTNNRGQHWDGTESSTYYEQKDGWGASAWKMSMEQRVKLPAGYYVLKASGRSASEAVVATMSVGGLPIASEADAATVSVRFPTKADVGYGITTDGLASFDPSGTYANGGLGRGWEWRYLPFYLPESTTVTIRLQATVEDAYFQWVSISNLSLLYSPVDPVPVQAPRASLNPTFSSLSSFYDLSGQRLSQPRRGVNLVRSGGTTQKVVVK